MHPVRAQARKFVETERGTLRGQGRFQVALCYPGTYGVAHASLGYQVIYRLIHEHSDFACERAVYPEDLEVQQASRIPLFTLESQRPVSDFDLLAFSVAFEPDLSRMIEMLDLAGLPPLVADRGENMPPVVVGGPVTLSNALPLGPFADAVVMGDGEATVPSLLTAFENASSRADLLQRWSDVPGVWVPSIHGDVTPDNQRVGLEHLPALGQIVTPYSELRNMFLVEASRGCPRMCTFCVVRATVSPMREADPALLLDAIPEWAPRVGFVGAAVTDYAHIREVLAGAIEQGKGIGISSLRADRLDEELVTLLKRGGYRTMTVAADAPSERQRAKIMKGIRERHLVRAAELARWAGLRTLKLYMVVGLPGERQEDEDDLVNLAEKLAAIMPLAITLSPFIPKLHTPLAREDFFGIKPMEAKLRRLRKRLGRKVDIRSTSARWAWIEYCLSQGGQDAGLAVLQAHRSGGRFAAWRDALNALPEPRRALRVAEEEAPWAVDGVDPSAPAPPRPPKRLPWTGTTPRGPAPV